VILVGLFTSWVFYRRGRPGSVSVSLLLTYPVVRFTLEGWFRGDTPPAFPSISGWLTIAQYVSIGGFAAGLVWLGVMLYTGRHGTPDGAS
jgi:prolipoprotein diacylglyceryltransferase